MANQHKQNAPRVDTPRESATVPSAPVTALTEKEQEVLHWIALGKSTWEISRIQGCTEAAVNFHLCNLRRKFGVNSMRAALVKAIDQKIVILH